MNLHNFRLALRLLSINGMGPRRIMGLKAVFPEIEDIFTSSITRLCEVPGIDYKIATKILKSFENEEIETEIRQIEDSPFDVVTIFDPDYPTRLKSIYDPPIVIYFLGEFLEQDADAISVVGTRNPSRYGKDATELLVRGLVEHKLTVISGFARGTDTEAHRSALKYGGRTIAVLGNGIDRIYPPENHRLKHDLIKSGVYLSEFPLGTKPDAINFPRRNRIISGLSLGVLVIEAGEKSGALITAYYALDQNREVFAVPGRVSDKLSQGTNTLIQNGAKLVSNIEDILNEIETNRKFPRKIEQLQINFKLSAEEKQIYDALSGDPVQIDELCQQIGKTSYETLAVLLSLELKGIVRQLPGKLFCRSL